MQKPKRLLVPVDFSDASRDVLEYAVMLARLLGASIRVVHVWEPPNVLATEAMAAVPGWSTASLEVTALESARKRIDALVKDFQVDNIAFTTTVEVGGPGPSILRVAEEDGADLIVMGTHGRSGLKRMLLGSVAQRVVSHAHCAVLTVPLRH